MKISKSILINKSPEEVFAVLSALDRFNDWLPASEDYFGTDLTSDLPVREGSTYNVRSPRGIRPGVVETFQPPKRLVFVETLGMPIGKISIRIEYILTPEGQGTKMERDLTIEAPLLARPMLKAQEGKLRSGIELYMQSIKAEIEKTR